MKEILPINGQFEMPTLQYVALDNAITAATMNVHHGKHLKAYIDNLNRQLPDSGLEGLSLQEVVRRSTGSLFNNAGQVLNHTMYFEQFSNTPHAMSQRMERLIADNFGPVEAFKKEFEQKGLSLFGSGWVWLSAGTDGALVITQQPNAANPITEGLTPLLTFDVWEHAYYLDYKNDRASYLASLWKVVDWEVVEARL